MPKILMWNKQVGSGHYILPNAEIVESLNQMSTLRRFECECEIKTQTKTKLIEKIIAFANEVIYRAHASSSEYGRNSHALAMRQRMLINIKINNHIAEYEGKIRNFVLFYKFVWVNCVCVRCWWAMSKSDFSFYEVCARTDRNRNVKLNSFVRTKYLQWIYIQYI